MRLNETPALPMAPESAYDRALQRALTDILRPILRKLNALDTSASTFTAPTLLNGWLDFGSGYPPAGYAVDGLGVVRLRGLIKSGALGASAFVLPAGFRPGGTCIFPVASNSAFGCVFVGADGTVLPTVGSNSWVSLDGITFKAA